MVDWRYSVVFFSIKGIDVPIVGNPIKKKRGRKPKNYQPHLDEQISRPEHNGMLDFLLQFLSFHFACMFLLQHQSQICPIQNVHLAPFYPIAQFRSGAISRRVCKHYKSVIVCCTIYMSSVVMRYAY